MFVENLPKDVWVIILKQLSLKELLQMRQICKHLNLIVKTKFQRFWFRRYINLIIRTGDYAKKYKINIPKIHNHGVYLKTINLFIPYISCYRITRAIELKYLHPLDYELYLQEGNEILKKYFPDQICLHSNPMIDSGNFPNIYAYTKILENHYTLICHDRSHFVFDLPKNDKDDEWFANHDIIYNANECYLSHYLITYYRIKRDGLDQIEYSRKRKRMSIEKEKFANSPFYNKMLLKHKVI